MRTLANSIGLKTGFWQAGLLLGLAAAFTDPVFAVSPEVWKVSAFAEFSQGDAERVAIANPGEIRLSPSCRLFSKIPESAVWSLVENPKGDTLFAGTGNRARIYKIDCLPDAATSEAKLFADLEGSTVQTMRMSPDGQLYAAVSPGGNVYKISPEGAVTLVGETKRNYVWEMDFDPDGKLILAAGDKGGLLRMKMDGEIEDLVKIEEKHVLSLVCGPAGKCYFGTAPNGWVGVVDASKDFRILYDSPLSEVKGLTLDDAGTVYAGVVPTLKIEPQSESPQAAAANSTKKKEDKSSELVRILPDGLAIPLGKTDNAAVNRLHWDGEHLLVGTGDEGKLFQLGYRDNTDLVTDLEPTDILALTKRGAGGTWMGTANPSSVYLFPVGTEKGGVYAVKPLDAGVPAQWGMLSWKASVPKGATLDFQTRSGNTEEPDDGWSDWSDPVLTSSKVTSPPARFLQWRSRFGGNEAGQSATVYEIEIVYQKMNQPPRITAAKIGDQSSSSASASKSSGDSSEGADSSESGHSKDSSPPKPGSSKNLAIAWQASDANGDTLVYDLHYRRIGETLWKKIEEDLKTSKYVWDLVAMPDGDYEIRVTVSDRLANPPDSTREDLWISEAIRVDTTAPEVGEWKDAKSEGSTFSVQVEVRDKTSRLTAVERVVDGDEEKSQPLLPTDGILDGSVEVFSVQVRDLEPGEHSMAVRAKDEMGNIGSDSLLFTIP